MTDRMIKQGFSKVPLPLFPLMKLKLLKKETEFCYGIDSSTPDLDPALLLWLFAFLPESNVR